MVVAVSVVTDNRIRRDVIELSAHAHAELLAAHRLSRAISRVEIGLRQLVAARERERTPGPSPQGSQTRSARAALDQALIEMRAAAHLASSPSAARASRSAIDEAAEARELGALAELESAIQRLEVGARELDATIETLSAEDAQRAAGVLLIDMSRDVAPRLGLVTEDAQDEVAGASEAFATNMRNARRMELAAITMALLLALLVGTITARAISRPITALREAAVRFGRGELDAPVALPSRDEMAELGDALQEMASNLRRTMAMLTDTLQERDRAQATLLEFNSTLEKSIEERTGRLQQVIDAAPFGAALYELFPYQRLVFMGANRSADQILRVETRQFVGKTIEEAFPDVANTPLPDQCRRVARDGVTLHVGPIAYEENGIEGTFDVHLVPLGPNRMALFFADITEQVRAYDETLAGWSRAMDVRDRETEGHTQRVTETTIALARAMRVSETEIVYMRWGALLHDIGKIGVPDSILMKPGPLTDEEWTIMRRHPEIARDMLEPIAFLKNALAIPYCHHEWWDGSGYPRGLAGVEIPLAARIFAVADVWDALRSRRPYHGAWPAEEALAYIRKHAGRQFDPAVVAVFEALVAGASASGGSGWERVG